MHANAEAEVGDRPVPQEPMYILLNLAISTAFGAIDYEGLEPLWPQVMTIEYVRLYQDPDRKNIGCDPVDYPTAEYIARYRTFPPPPSHPLSATLLRLIPTLSCFIPIAEGYSNTNITTWNQVRLLALNLSRPQTQTDPFISLLPSDDRLGSLPQKPTHRHLLDDTSILVPSRLLLLCAFSLHLHLPILPLYPSTIPSAF